MKWRRKDIYDEMGKEQVWFAWYPVPLDVNPKQTVWLEKVIRVRKSGGNHSYTYSPIPPQSEQELE